MKTPRTRTEREHACPMPRPRRKFEHAIYVCDCRCGWRASYAYYDFACEATWRWEQVL
jgi:hypothetical protein